MKHFIFCLLGASSSGKDKLYRLLLQDFSLPLRRVVLCTTRPKRSGEEEGEQYYFRTERQYEAQRQEGRIIEERSYATACGLWRYYTADDGQIDLSVSSSLVIATPEALAGFRRYFGADRVVPLYIHVEDGERLARALRRERKQEKPQYAEMCRRFLADAEDFAPARLEEAGIGREDTFENPDGSLMECKEALAVAIREKLDLPDKILKLW